MQEKDQEQRAEGHRPVQGANLGGCQIVDESQRNEPRSETAARRFLLKRFCDVAQKKQVTWINLIAAVEITKVQLARGPPGKCVKAIFVGV